MKSTLKVAIVCIVTAAGAFGQLPYSNGPLVTHPGGGFGGADASALETLAGGTVYGYSVSSAAGARIADDFAVPCGQTWSITDIVVYSYQTGSTTTSTFTAGNYIIWSGPPNAGGTILYDYSAANQMTLTGFSNDYRVLDTGLLVSNRPIMFVAMAGNGISLPAGSYWLDWQLTGSLASGPWSAPITILGMSLTGNSLQNFAGVWTPLVDVGAKGMPFDIFGAVVPSNCFALNILQPGGPGTPLTLADTAGVPGSTAINVITLFGGAFPVGWLFGVDIPLLELGGILAAGPPFVVTLDGLGNYILGPIGVPVLGVTVYYVGLNLVGSTLSTADAAKSITL